MLPSPIHVGQCALGSAGGASPHPSADRTGPVESQLPGRVLSKVSIQCFYEQDSSKISHPVQGDAGRGFILCRVLF